VRLEQDAQGIKVQAKKQETQADLVDKRAKLQDLYDRLEELNQVSANFSPLMAILIAGSSTL
jgi:hypothetical protein